MESGSISLNEIFNDFLELILQNTGNLLLILIWCFNNVLKHQRKRLIKLYHASPLCVQATIRYSIAWHHNCFINVLKNHAQHILTLSKSQCLRKIFTSKDNPNNKVTKFLLHLFFPSHGALIVLSCGNFIS